MAARAVAVNTDGVGGKALLSGCGLGIIEHREGQGCGSLWPHRFEVEIGIGLEIDATISRISTSFDDFGDIACDGLVLHFVECI